MHRLIDIIFFFLLGCLSLKERGRDRNSSKSTRESFSFLLGAGFFFFKDGANRIYMWVERNKLVEKRRDVI